MIYDLNGSTLSSAFDKSGNASASAYDITGDQVFATIIKVMTYNVGGWYCGSGTNVPSAQDAEYYALQNGMLSEHSDVDVLCLQEYMTNFSELPRTADSVLSPYFTYRNCRQSGTYFGRGICSKTEITGYTTNAYTAESSRYYDKAYVELGGKQIAIFTTHLGLTLANRQSEIAELITALQNEEYFIACGDFNMLDCKSVSGEDYTAIIEPILNAGFNSANCTDYGFLETYSDQPTGTYTGCLDNIVTSSNIDILSASVDTTKLTDNLTEKADHMPLIAELQIN